MSLLPVKFENTTICVESKSKETFNLSLTHQIILSLKCPIQNFTYSRLCCTLNKLIKNSIYNL